MNWPSPAEFTWLLFLAFFFSWIKAILCTATAIIVRRRVVGIAIAFVIGVVESAVDHPRDIFFVQFLDFFNDVALALSGLAGVCWWCIGRALRTIAIYAYRAIAKLKSATMRALARLWRLALLRPKIGMLAGGERHDRRPVDVHLGAHTIEPGGARIGARRSDRALHFANAQRRDWDFSGKRDCDQRDRVRLSLRQVRGIPLGRRHIPRGAVGGGARALCLSPRRSRALDLRGRPGAWALFPRLHRDRPAFQEGAGPDGDGPELVGAALRVLGARGDGVVRRPRHRCGIQVSSAAGGQHALISPSATG